MTESVVQVQLQRPTSFKVKLQVEPDAADAHDDIGPRDEDESSKRPYSENSWREQLLRLVREAPQPVPVLCSEPRRFPHFGTSRLSESSWTSDTTRYTSLTLSQSNSLTGDGEILDAEAVGDVSSQNHHNNQHASPSEEDGSTGRILESVTTAKHIDTDVDTPSSTVETHESEKNDICGNEVDDDHHDHDQVNKSSESGNGEEQLPSSSLSSKPQEDCDTSNKVKINEEDGHQLQADENSNGGKHNIHPLDPQYWEKFRFSKDYQSSLMIETICNEVFNLMPSSRYKSLMKLSEKRKVEQRNKIGKKSPLQSRNKNRGSVEGINAESIEKTKELQTNENGSNHLNQSPEDRKASNASTATVSSVCTTTTAEDEIGEDIQRRRFERMLMMEGFGKPFHGYLTKRETEDLLRANGQYLIRQMWREDGFILSLRFDDEVKNYRIICTPTITTTTIDSNFEGSNSTGSNVLYTYQLENRYKPYKSLDELVREGLITLHLDENAGSYIDLLMELAKQQKNDNLLQTPPAVTPGSRKNSRSASLLRMMRLNSSCSTSSTAGGVENNVSRPSPGSLPRSSSKSASTSSSSAKRNSVNIALLIHFFEEEIFDGLAKCQVCSHALWGSTNKGLKCRDCSLAVHESCIDNVKRECKPNLTSISPFSTDLTTLVKGSLSRAEGSSPTHGPPYILEKCVNEVEARGGLATEGIYRVSGSVEEIEGLKKMFEKDRVNTSLSECSDIHSITSLIKFFLRQLPDPLITQEVFEEFIRGESGEITGESVQMLVSCLPPAHRITLKYILDHLDRIVKERLVNKMNAFNLSSVLVPSVLGPASMNFENLETSMKLLHYLIAHVHEIQF